MGKLSACTVQFTLEACEPIRLNQYPGSALRGALLEAVLQRFCMNPAATSCLDCPLHATCPVAGLVAPMRDEYVRGRDIPRPFVLGMAPSFLVDQGPDHQQDRIFEHSFQAGESFGFSLTLVGTAARLFPYVALSLPALELLGLGSRLRGQGSHRGRVRIVRVEAVHPWSGVTEVLYTGGQLKVQMPSQYITAEDIASRAAQLSPDCLVLRFLTPTRLIADGHLLRQPLFRPLILRLAERLGELEGAYGEGESGDSEDAQRRSFERYSRYSALAQQAHLVEQQIKWIELASYSSRQQRTTPIGGFVGSATFAGVLEELRELLVWGELFHVGKNAVKGDGSYRIRPAESAG